MLDNKLYALYSKTSLTVVLKLYDHNSGVLFSENNYN